MVENSGITVEEALQRCPVKLFSPGAHAEMVNELGLLGTREMLGTFWKATTIQVRRGELSPEQAVERALVLGSVRRAMRDRALQITDGQLVQWGTNSDGERPIAVFINRPYNVPDVSSRAILAEYVMALRISIATIAKTGIDASIHTQMQDRLVGFEETLAGMDDKTGQSLDNCREKLARGELLATRGRPPWVRPVTDLALK